MPSQRNQQAARRYFEEYHDRRQTQLLDELVAEELRPATAAAQATVERAFPDYRISVDWQVADDDAVATGWSAQGTHSGPWDGPTGIVEATGRGVRWTGTTTLRLRDGMITEVLGTHWDHLGILQQMGVVGTAVPRPGA